MKRTMLGLALALAVVATACASDSTDTTTTAPADDTTTTAPADATTTTSGTGADETTTTAVAQPNSNPEACIDSVEQGVDYFPDKVVADYSEQWTVDYHDTYKVVDIDITHADPTTDPVYETYVLVNCGAEAPALEGELAGAFVFTIPLERFVESGGGTYASIEMLGLEDKLVGWRRPPSGLEYLPAIDAVSNDVVEIGYYGEENYETLVALDPDGMTTYGAPEFKQQARDLGIPTFEFHPFSEGPLGSAEQLKFLSMFFNAEAEANELYGSIETTYTDLLADVSTVEEMPAVLIGNPNSSGDFSTRSHTRIESLLVLDAGGTLVLDDSQMDFSGFQPTVSLEVALAAGADAPFWYSMAYDPVEETASEFIATDPNNGRFEAMCAGNAFHRFGRGEDYFSTPSVRVDEMLADLVSIIHPELLPDHELIHIERIVGDC